MVVLAMLTRISNKTAVAHMVLVEKIVKTQVNKITKKIYLKKKNNNILSSI